MPWRRLPRISLRCCSSGRPLISTTLSSMRVNTFTTSRYSSQSKRAFGPNGSRTKVVRLTEPSRHEPYGGKRLLAAVVRVQAVAVEGVDARHLHVVDVLDAVGVQRSRRWRRNARG